LTHPLLLALSVFFSRIRPPATSTLFPYTTLFRSRFAVEVEGGVEAPLEADRRRGLRAHRAPARAAGAVGGIDLDAGSSCGRAMRDRKSTRLNSSHVAISYAVFCLKKKKDHHVATR